jgi:hypothetical protein
VRRALAALAAVLLPVVGGALEPRFDHRDAHGPLVELLQVHDTLVVSGRTTSAWRTAIRAGWGFDVSGEGSELVLSADAALRSWDDPDRDHVLLTASARYRTYFGTEQWKSYLEAGIWAPILSRLGVGPLLGIGVAYDFSQDWGVYGGAQVSTSIGDGRVVSLGGLAGFQLRFAIP